MKFENIGGVMPNSRAQGTVEYLVIVAVVIVLSLVVVGLVLTQTDKSQQISSSGNNLGTLSQSIGITESLIDPSDGNFIVRLLNNSGEHITVSNVKVGDANVAFSEDLAQSSSKFFRVDTSAVCEQGKVVSQDVAVTYVTVDGLTKTMRYPAQVMFDCTPYIVNASLVANQCPSPASGNAIASQVLSGYTFSNSSSVDLVGSLKKYVNLGTGQSTCYTAGGVLRNCSSTGEDGGTYGASFAHVWVDNGDNTDRDLNSGLMWQRGKSGAVSWQAALDYCNNNTPALPELVGDCLIKKSF